MLLVLPTRTNAGIYRVDLSEHKTLLSISQQLMAQIDDIGNHREFAFVEVLPEGIDAYRLTVLPHGVTSTLRLIDGRSGSERDILSIRTPQGATVPSTFIVTPTSTAYLVTAADIIVNSKKNESFFIPIESENSATENENLISLRAISSAENPTRAKISLDLPSTTPVDLTLVSPSVTILPDGDAQNIPLEIKMKYTDQGTSSKTIYSYEGSSGQWVPLSSYHNVEGKFLTGVIRSFPATVAVFADPAAHDGIASWYAFRGCLCAASRRYPPGSRVKVTRLKTGKSVEVRINDYGPEEWTGREIDLDKTAFARIGSLRVGLIYIKTEILTKK